MTTQLFKTQGQFPNLISEEEIMTNPIYSGLKEKIEQARIKQAIEMYESKELRSDRGSKDNCSASKKKKKNKNKNKNGTNEPSSDVHCQEEPLIQGTKSI